MSLKSENSALENTNVVLALGAVAPEMYVETSSGQLAIQMTKSEEIVGAEQDVNGPRAVGKRLDHFQLVRQPSARGHASQMLGLVDQNGGRLPVLDG
jgi:hypothetical protein